MPVIQMCTKVALIYVALLIFHFSPLNSTGQLKRLIFIVNIYVNSMINTTVMVVVSATITNNQEKKKKNPDHLAIL